MTNETLAITYEDAKQIQEDNKDFMIKKKASNTVHYKP
jgi:hypothetical protein